ncbi:MAG: hypothetical protein GBAus27B_000218 [Mycoplasmataceae bacterium]|nr:MAG: hypothetical protein GBAus27B_000218 [Mycoplasmataceae bacterium]
MNYQKIKDSHLFHLAVALLLGVGLAWGYDKWVANKE